MFYAVVTIKVNRIKHKHPTNKNNSNQFDKDFQIRILLIDAGICSFNAETLVVYLDVKAGTPSIPAH
jgi:hypothetical protein